jgi:hypothetical protein
LHKITTTDQFSDIFDIISAHNNGDDTNIEEQCIEETMGTRYVYGRVVKFSTPIIVINNCTHTVDGNINYNSGIITHLCITDRDNQCKGKDVKTLREVLTNVLGGITISIISASNSPEDRTYSASNSPEDRTYIVTVRLSSTGESIPLVVGLHYTEAIAIVNLICVPSIITSEDIFINTIIAIDKLVRFIYENVETE